MEAKQPIRWCGRPYRLPKWLLSCLRWASKNALALSLAYAKENPKVKGKTSLDRLLREGKELKIIALQSKDVGQFKELAKQYGVLFAVVKDKAQNEKVDVMFKAEDVSKLNRIYEQLGYAIPKVTTADRKKDPTAVNPTAAC